MPLLTRLKLGFIATFIGGLSSGGYSMDSFDDRNCDDHQKKQIQSLMIQNIMESYAILNDQGRYTLPGEERGDISVPGWMVVKKRGTYQDQPIIYSVLRRVPHLSPSEALDAVFQGKGRMDCHMAAQFVLLRCIKKLIMGPKKYKALTEYWEMKNPKLNTIGPRSLPSVASMVAYVGLWGEHGVGSWVYFPNIPDVKSAYPRASFAGHNVFCVGHNDLGEMIYQGYGDFFHEPKTERQILDHLYGEYTKIVAYEEMRSSMLHSDLFKNSSKSSPKKKKKRSFQSQITQKSLDRAQWEDLQKQYQSYSCIVSLSWEKMSQVRALFGYGHMKAAL